MNAILPDDVWIAAAFEMRDDFHPRYSAVSRDYSYYVGTDDLASSPFRRGHELAWHRRTDLEAMGAAARALLGEHSFHSFAVKGTAPESDDHRCTVSRSAWRDRPGGLAYDITANRFLHHMVRFLVGTMLDIGEGRRPPETVADLLGRTDNSKVSPPAPPHALFLERVDYPKDLYLDF
jgi:tRNA pseudouridine38-40 synthase